MDLNLYLGLPRSPRPCTLGLGPDLALSSLYLPSSSTTIEDVRVPVPMSGAVEPSDSHPPYSPSHAEYTPDMPAVLPFHRIDTPEYTPFPSNERYGESSSAIPPIIRDPEGPDVPYSPSSVQPLPALQEPDETAVQDDDSHMVYYPASPLRRADEPVFYSPPYVSGSTNSQDHETATFRFYPSMPMQTGQILCPEDGPSSRPEPLHTTEAHFRRLTESSLRWPNRQFRSLLQHAGERSSFLSPSVPIREQPVCDTLSSQRSLEHTGKHKVSAENDTTETSQEEREEKGRSAANFECNICFDMAVEPVVTSCGHLFCWPCLYQWLHVHSDFKECPVCKGVVTESNITPIYGRGSLQPTVEKNTEDEVSDLTIPPRPRGNRFESFRQLYRPVSRRLGEGIVLSWRRLLDQHMHRENRHEDPSLQEIFDSVHRRALSRMRARRLQREVNPESGSITEDLGLPINNVPNPIRSNTNSIFRDGANLWPQNSMYDHGTDREIGNMVGQNASSSNGYGLSTSSADPLNLEPPTIRHHAESVLAADQASASSTMAMIQGDAAATDALAEPNSAGYSRSSRRRVRSNTYGSFDVDESTLHSFGRPLVPTNRPHHVPSWQA
ncbi:unnamed protein product [Musa acuminata subsp. burmannicoides]